MGLEGDVEEGTELVEGGARAERETHLPRP